MPKPVLALASALSLMFLFAAIPGMADETSTPAPAAAPPAPLLPGMLPDADLKRAAARLHDWEEATPQKGERLLRICYWSPADREPQPAHRERLTRVMKHIQGFYAKQMAGYGFPGRSIKLGFDGRGLIDITMVKGTLRNTECSEQDPSDGRAIRADCLKALKARGIDGERETLVIFCNLAEWDPVTRRMSHHSPYYAAGNSTQGTAWQLDSPLLDADSLGVKDQFLDDGQYGRISLGKYNSIFVGGVCHELGHSLGLPHCKQCAGCREKKGTALMGSGNRTYGEDLRGESLGSFLTVGHALKLAAHPQFSGSVKEMAAPARVELDGWQFDARADGLEVRGQLRSALPVHAVIGYADPAGGDDYDAEIAAAVPDANGRFKLLLPHPEGRRSTTAELHFVAVCANGAATASVWSSQAKSFAVRVDGAGRLDVGGIAAVMAWETVEKARRTGQLAAGSPARAALPAAQQELLRRLDLPDTSAGKPAPAAVPADCAEKPLSDCAPVRATTGWRGAHYDRTCDGGALVGPEGPARHGLWAHADAEHAYDLGGAWKRLKGSCGLLQNGHAQLTFTIVADGKTVWTSKRNGGGIFDLDVTGVKELVLSCKAKNMSNAWGGWLEPVLAR